MKKWLKILLIVVFILIGLLVGFFIYQYSSNGKTVTNRNDLYEKVEQYLISQEKQHYYSAEKYAEVNYDITNLKVFTDIAQLGIKQKNDEFYVYVWALVESYYVQDGKVVGNSGSSMPYKFTIRNDEIVDYEIPQDGSYYAKSIKRIFPIDIRVKLDDGLVDATKLDNEVKEYYSFLDSFNPNNVTTIDIVQGGFIPEGETIKKVTLNQEEIYSIFNILNNISFSSETCDGLADYFIKINTEEKESAYTYGLEMYNSSYHITTVINEKSSEAILSSAQRNEIDKIINKYFGK